ncbi:MAG: basic secretory family protein [Syntrophaceae bacterium]|nr:basic secretory family protein [Syntrophaceae bacterium]
MPPCFRIHRPGTPGQYRLADLFPDIGRYEILAELFTDPVDRDRILAEIPVFLTNQGHSIFVSNDDGSITIALSHLRDSPDEVLYLDIIHELCHVKQHREGRELYDRSKSYVDRETEIDAYRFTVREARRIGLTDPAISDYLCVPWITEEEHRRLCRRLGVEESPPCSPQNQPD